MQNIIARARKWLQGRGDKSKAVVAQPRQPTDFGAAHFGDDDLSLITPQTLGSRAHQSKSSSSKVAPKQADGVQPNGQSASTHGRQYGPVTIGGLAQVQQGDVVTVNNFFASGPHQNRYRVLLESLVFARMGARVRNVTAALPDTCTWLFSHEKFTEWLDRDRVRLHNGFLWVKGKPGSGKSTIMKAALSWTERKLLSESNINYFFNARSTGQLEKSSLGLYRSLVFQLLCAQRKLRPRFLASFSSKEMNGEVEQWSEHELQNFLVQAVQARWLDAPVHIFIDALDEGDEDDVRQMIGHFEDVARLAASSRVPLRICLSSRHYPHISIEKGVSIVVEDQQAHNEDIELYVLRKLRGQKNVEMDELRQEVLQKAAGVFLWVVLVVPLLNCIYDRGQGLKQMLDKLKSIPKDLHELFSDIFKRSDEGLHECIMLFQWVLYSIRPLQPDELYAVLHHTGGAVDRYSITTAGTNSSNENVFINRYLLNCSRGLVELTKGQPPIVQFIHETVRDYLIENTVVLLVSHRRLSASDIVEADFEARASNAAIAKGCMDYLFDTAEVLPLSFPWLSMSCLDRSANEILQKKALWRYPLLNYAGQYWHKHLRTSEGLSSQKLGHLAVKLLTRNLDKWGLFCDPIQSYCFGRKDLSPPLYYAALLGVPSIVSYLLKSGADVNPTSNTSETPLAAASNFGHEQVVQMLLDAGAVDCTGSVLDGRALCQASSRGDAGVVKLLLNGDYNFTRQGTLASDALRYAALYGRTEVVQHLIEAGVHMSPTSALQAAASNGHDKILLMLLKAGIDQGPLIRTTEWTSFGETKTVVAKNCLCAALIRCYDDVVTTLRKGASPETWNTMVEDGMRKALYDKDEDMVKKLLTLIDYCKAHPCHNETTASSNPHRSIRQTISNLFNPDDD